MMCDRLSVVDSNIIVYYDVNTYTGLFIFMM